MSNRCADRVRGLAQLRENPHDLVVLQKLDDSTGGPAADPITLAIEPMVTRPGVQRLAGEVYLSPGDGHVLMDGLQ